jgi:hypothetical protein
MARLMVRCNDGDPTIHALKQVSVVIRPGRAPMGAGPFWAHLRRVGFSVAEGTGPAPGPAVETSEATKVGEEFAAGILRSAFTGHLIKRDSGTGLYYVP